ncbi:protein phosphatase 1 regulatory subunit 12A isoform X9 [Lucilia sericata]|uniref:protein phosphatase 1 regulatory subunit 12A isoform X9 n=1 Tax=Lucilia sericata TaxID=13632 RepID=UPI0018A7F7F2|nr:protein phosphatase 1 regulatory subunit 12A isoform X9 [Lucilia sericata]
MTSLDIRNNSAVMKRAEQLKRWEESDTNQQPPVPRPERGSRIKFSSGCIFLAACLAGDKEEVLKMLEQGADINTANVDGLTALHQACIDDNLEMVEFLVEQGADINRQDNEGWTPLHATASCGFVSIARYLVEHGADVAAVNSDGDLAVDLAVDIQHLPMIDFMQKMVSEQQIDCAKARQAEEQQMLSDAKKWLRSDASEVDRPHPKTGATALHVAAAKGYTKVLSLLLAGRANVDAKDNDGWTPLHAAAHWGQKESAEMLLDAMADMDVTNYAGQTCIDVADRKMVKFLEEYRASNKRMKRRPSSQIRISDTIENHIDKTPTKIIRVEVRPENNKDHVNDDKSSMQKTTNETPATEDEAPWRRNNVTRVRSTNESPIKNQVPDNEVSKTNNATTETDVILRRTQSFENDEKKSPPISPSVTSTPATAATTTNTSSPAAVTTPIRRSFVPPVRDEESETQRKAHAKRVRETRRSTQGVTLDEIKSAEELVKKKNSTMNNNNNNNSSSNEMQANVTNETTTTTTTSTTTPITATTIEQDLSKEQEQKQSQLQKSEETDEIDKETNTSKTKEVNSEQTEDVEEDITASFTIIAPSSVTKARPASLIVTATSSTSKELSHNDEEVSATFVMPQRKESRTPTPTTENVETTLVVKPVLKDNSPTREVVDKKMNKLLQEEDGNEKYSKSSTHNKENENYENKKTEPPPLPDVELMESNSNQQPLNKITTSQRAQSSERIRTAFFNPLPLVTQNTTLTTNTNVNSNSSANSSNTTPTLDSPVRLRDKRSLFDLDNASSQTLADKLRTEANKYCYDEKRCGMFAAETSAIHDISLERDTSASPLLGGVGAGGSVGSANTSSYNYNTRRSLDSSSLPNSPLHTRDREAAGSDTSSTTSTITSVGAGGAAGSGGNVGGSFNNILAADRRPSWRLKFDSGSKFKLEDATSGNTYPPNNSTIIPSAPAVIAAANSMSQRRVNSSNISSSNQSLNSIGRPVSAPPTSNLSNNSTTTASSNTSNTSSSSHSNNDDKLNDNSSSSSSFTSYPSRRSTTTATSTTSLTPDSQTTGTSTSNTVNTSTSNLHSSNNDDKDNDKENDNRSALATQAVIQRRRKPKRRSTGVVHIDMDELDPEKQDSANDNEEKEKEVSDS